MVARHLAALVLIVLLGASSAGLVLAHNVVRDSEDRLRSERTAAALAVLNNIFDQMKNSLHMLDTVADVHAEAAPAVFAQVLAQDNQQNQGVVALAAAKPSGSGFVMTAAAGAAPAAGTRVPDLLVPLLARARSAAPEPVVQLLSIAGHTALIAAVSNGGAIVWQASIVPGATPISGGTNPFRDMRGAMYLGTPDPSRLMLTTESRLPLTGRVDSSTIRFGQDEFTMLTSTGAPLVGEWTNRMPWLVFGAGVIIAVAVASALSTISRRRDYARAQVRAATRDLAAANEEIRRGECFLDRLVTAGPVAVLRVDVETVRTTYSSPNLQMRFGFTREQAAMPGFPLECVEPADRPRLKREMHAVIHGYGEGDHANADRPTGLEVRLWLPSGEMRWVSVVIVKDTEQAGAVLMYLLDVDVQRRAEEAQRAAVKVAEDANRSKSEFVSRMSHELRTPLNAVLGYGQLLELDDLSESQSECVRQILSGGRHLLGLINEVLDISSMESGRLPMHTETLQIGEIVGSVIGMLRPLADAAGVTIVDEVSAACAVRADAQRTRQVLLNLLTNAVKYNRRDGLVTVRCRSNRDGHALIEVSDTGVGIEPEDLERAFAPFERLGAQHSDVEGTGIGLWLSRRLAEAMHGSLTAVSEKDFGTTMLLTLPSALPADRPADVVRADSTPLLAARPTVLHIDDHAPNRELVESIFRRHPEVELMTVESGKRGLAVARATHPSLVLLDLHLPDVDGAEVMRLLHADPATADIPVVILSADATPDQVDHLVSDGAAAYLTKPVDVSELLSVVKDLVVAR
jgi:signal transduction histidine kinase/CheY-like chemotaxis protein